MLAACLRRVGEPSRSRPSFSSLAMLLARAGRFAARPKAGMRRPRLQPVEPFDSLVLKSLGAVGVAADPAHARGVVPKGGGASPNRCADPARCLTVDW
jgi:hypothetical protein